MIQEPGLIAGTISVMILMTQDGVAVGMDILANKQMPIRKVFVFMMMIIIVNGISIPIHAIVQEEVWD